MTADEREAMRLIRQLADAVNRLGDEIATLKKEIVSQEQRVCMIEGYILTLEETDPEKIVAAMSDPFGGA